MGDRAVVGIREKSSEPTLFLYLHWAGSEQDAMLGDALQLAQSRIEMGDAAYATRIIISQMTKGLEDSETGAGLYIGGTRHGADYYTINSLTSKPSECWSARMTTLTRLRWSGRLTTSSGATQPDQSWSKKSCGGELTFLQLPSTIKIT